MAAIMVWAALGIYLLGYVLSVRPLAARTLDNMIGAFERAEDEQRRLYPATWSANHPKGWESLPMVPTDSGRIRATWYALGKAIFWPIVIPVHMTARTVVSPTERLRASERENARLRKLAADEGLTWPGDETR
jgi:hypothetical protein